jgi:hypothetical protein
MLEFSSVAGNYSEKPPFAGSFWPARHAATIAIFHSEGRFPGMGDQARGRRPAVRLAGKLANA